MLLLFAWNLTFAPYAGGKGEYKVVEELAKAYNAETHAEAHQSCREKMEKWTYEKVKVE